MSRSDELFERAVKVIPGGVNSPVRAYGSVGMTPRFIEGASGPYVVDADSKKYIDYISSWTDDSRTQQSGSSERRDPESRERSEFRCGYRDRGGDGGIYL